MKKSSFTVRHTGSCGVTLIEVVIAAAMLTAALASFAMYYKKVLDVSHDTTLHIQSGFLLEEGLEAAKMLRDKSWSTQVATLSTTTTYYFYWSGTEWTATTTLQKVENIFTRSFTVSDVRRDALDRIAPVGTYYDKGTKKITVFVTWVTKGSRKSTTDAAETYIANLFNN